MPTVYKTLGCFVLATIGFISCKKEVFTVAENEIEYFESLLNPPRQNVLIKANGNLYFMKDSIANTRLLNTGSTEITEMVLSPNGKEAIFLDSDSALHLINTTSQQSQSKKVLSFGSGIQHIHYTALGDIYAVYPDGTIKINNNQHYPNPDLGIRSTGSYPDIFYDAVIMPDSSIYFSYQRYSTDNFSYNYHFQKWWPSDSTIEDINYSILSFREILRFQSNKEGELVVYTNDGKTIILSKDGEINSDKFQQGEGKMVSSIGAYLSHSYISDSLANAIVFKNELKNLGYPYNARDTTYIFKTLPAIEDFDIQMPSSTFLDLSPLFNPEFQ